ncbi:hypothetical protein LCGC14_1914440 [marine sediment metagenome]|uniref:Uncharacterized protein n=1 Tax=marine sediment metagenome TaxID=412755 RepID=A0A0F9GFW8_9ZZZZ
MTIPPLEDEFWGPVGMGCSHCHEEPPAVVTIARGVVISLGMACLGRWWPGRTAAWVEGWIDRQMRIYGYYVDVKAIRERNLRDGRNDPVPPWPC